MRQKKLNKRAKIHVHIDTGIKRIGISYYNALPAIERISQLKNIHFKGISSTMIEDSYFDKIQLKRFMEICLEAQKKGLNIGKKHVVRSGALFNLLLSYLNMVRH
jgi:alanine racemase